jgi:hypothetical protein
MTMKIKPNGKYAKLKQAFDLIKKHKAQFDGRFIKYQKKVKAGAKITFIYENPNIKYEGYISFAEDCKGSGIDTFSVPGESIFDYMSEKELKKLLKTGAKRDNFTVLSINKYIYSYQLTLISPNE